VYIKFLLTESCTAAVIHNCFSAVYGAFSPNYSTITRSFNEFKHGHQSVEGDPCSDAVNQFAVAAVENTLFHDNSQYAEGVCSLGSLKPHCTWSVSFISSCRQRAVFTVWLQWSVDNMSIHHSDPQRQLKSTCSCSVSAPPKNFKLSSQLVMLSQQISGIQTRLLMIDYRCSRKTTTGLYYAELLSTLHCLIKQKVVTWEYDNAPSQWLFNHECIRSTEPCCLQSRCGSKWLFLVQKSEVLASRNPVIPIET